MGNLQPEQKFISLSEFKSIEDDNGGLKGYANNFGILDSYDDITIKGCFADSLKELIESGFGAVDHRWGIKDEIGLVDNATEDEIGLFVETSYHPTDDAQLIRQKVNHRLSKKKKVSMSIGYYATEKTYVVGEEAIPFLINPSQEVLTYLKEKQPIVRILQKCRIFEASVVSKGANGDSQVTEGKSSPNMTRDEIQAERKKQIAAGEVSPLKIKQLQLKLRMISAE